MLGVGYPVRLAESRARYQGNAVGDGGLQSMLRWTIRSQVLGFRGPTASLLEGGPAMPEGTVVESSRHLGRLGIGVRTQFDY